MKKGKKLRSIKKKRNNHDRKYFAQEFNSRIRELGELLLDKFKDSKEVEEQIYNNIKSIEEYFDKYDNIQLLGGIGLYLLDNIPSLEKYFKYGSFDYTRDESAEIIAEYAINFALAKKNDRIEEPPSSVILDLRIKLNQLIHLYMFIDMPHEKSYSPLIDWLIHMNTIMVRGDGFPHHLKEVFLELFTPHDKFLTSNFGFSSLELIEFFSDLNNRVICKIGDNNHISGLPVLLDRIKKWEKLRYGTSDPNIIVKLKDFSNGLWGDFAKENPDVPYNGEQFIPYPITDYKSSHNIFWIIPQNVVETNILNQLSLSFGDNIKFLSGEFKGNILNGYNIFSKPFIKDRDKFYCFTPMLAERNIFYITENLLKNDDKYYQANFRSNLSPDSRDNFIERKVKKILEKILPDVSFYSSVTYNINEDGIQKKPELDILGISENANYIIEVKAHELTYTDRVKLKGTKDKFRDSVFEACKQCHRTVSYIETTTKPQFGHVSGSISLDKEKPKYKIAVTFQHYAPLIGQRDLLEKTGMMDPKFRDTLVISLFDLMTISDFINHEKEFIRYLNLRKLIDENLIVFFDELDILGQFLNGNIEEEIKSNTGTDTTKLVVGGSDIIEKQYFSKSAISIKK